MKLGEPLVRLGRLEDDGLPFDERAVVEKQIGMIEDLEGGPIRRDRVGGRVAGFEILRQIEIELLGEGRVVVDEAGTGEPLLDAAAELGPILAEAAMPSRAARNQFFMIVGIELKSLLELVDRGPMAIEAG